MRLTVDKGDLPILKRKYCQNAFVKDFLKYKNRQPTWHTITGSKLVNFLCPKFENLQMFKKTWYYVVTK